MLIWVLLGLGLYTVALFIVLRYCLRELQRESQDKKERGDGLK